MTRAFFIANLFATLLACAVVALVASYGDAIAHSIGDLSLARRIRMGCFLTAIPLLLIWFPAFLGESPPPWISPRTDWRLVYATGWLMLIGLGGATLFALLVDEDGFRPFW